MLAHPLFPSLQSVQLLVFCLSFLVPPLCSAKIGESVRGGPLHISEGCFAIALLALPAPQSRLTPSSRAVREDTVHLGSVGEEVFDLGEAGVVAELGPD